MPPLPAPFGLISMLALENLTPMQVQRMQRLFHSWLLQAYLPRSLRAAARDYIVTGCFPKPSPRKTGSHSPSHSSSFA